MDTKEIFSKLNSRDYNGRLEKILENKDYSTDIKNLLLSMLYKIETAYKDYSTVKRIVEDKKIYIEEVLDIIQNKCEKIVVTKDLESKFAVDKLEKSIYLKYPNEELLLYTLYKLDDKQIYLDEKYNLIRNSLSELLNAGENINNIEVLRDFNGWNWNMLNREIPEITTNIIYQNLIYMLGINFIKDWLHKEEVVDYLEVVETKLKEYYGEENIDIFLNYIYKISIIICTNKNKIEKNRLLDEKIDLETELDKLQNKTELLNRISNFKKEDLKKIRQIDNIINDKKLLEEEYIKRNEKRSEYKKIFNISHLVEILNRERKKMLQNIEENNKLLDPKYYVQTKEKLKKQLGFLQDIDININQQEKIKYNYIIELQKIFIKCFNIKIEKASSKEEIINLIYMLRYYNLLYITEDKKVKDVKELFNERKLLEEKLINKAYEYKIINLITKEKTTNMEIIRSLLNTKIISLEDIAIELKENASSLEYDIYDGDIYEKTLAIQVYNKKELITKFNKKIKIFI